MLPSMTSKPETTFQLFVIIKETLLQTLSLANIEGLSVSSLLWHLLSTVLKPVQET